MRAIASARRNPVAAAWGAFALANLAAMVLWPEWETIPFHLLWVSLTLLFGVRMWRPAVTYLLLGAVASVTGGLILIDAFNGAALWGELFEVPLMSMMFMAMVWHARRRQTALQAVEQLADQRATLLATQKQFLDDVSHELRTPVTIARGHLETLPSLDHQTADGIDVALDELGRIERILERLLLLAKADRPDFLVPGDVELEPFLEDVFMRWAGVAPRAWRLGSLAPGTLRVDPDGLRIALDALLENAVKHTKTSDVIQLRAHSSGDDVVIEVADGGSGVPPAAVSRIFDRFARADPARTRSDGGVGLGLAIVDAIVRAHGGRCSVRTARVGSVFALRFPGFRSTGRSVPREQPVVVPAGP